MRRAIVTISRRVTGLMLGVVGTATTIICLLIGMDLIGIPIRPDAIMLLAGVVMLGVGVFIAFGALGWLAYRKGS